MRRQLLLSRRYCLILAWQAIFCFIFRKYTVEVEWEE